MKWGLIELSKSQVLDQFFEIEAGDTNKMHSPFDLNLQQLRKYWIRLLLGKRFDADPDDYSKSYEDKVWGRLVDETKKQILKFKSRGFTFPAKKELRSFIQEKYKDKSWNKPYISDDEIRTAIEEILIDSYLQALQLLEAEES